MPEKGARGPSPDLRDEVRGRVSRATKDLSQLGLQDILQGEVISHLLRARMTAAELTAEIYGQTREMPGFMGAYSRTRRALRELESKGYVVTRLLGRDKPYRLTAHAISRLAEFETLSAKHRLVTRKDIVLYASTLALAGLAILAELGYFAIEGFPFALFYAVFFMLVGASGTRFIQTIWRVI